MKAYLHENAPLTHRVLVVDDCGNAAGWPIEQEMSYAISRALVTHKNQELGQGALVPLALFGDDVCLLGEVIDNDVELACALLLLKYDGDTYYVVCGPAMRKLSAVERYLQDTIGTAEVELWPVAQENVSPVLQNHNELSKAAPCVTVVISVGGVLHAEAKGVPGHVALRVYRVLQQGAKSNPVMGQLTLHDGQVIDNVEEVTTDLIHLDRRRAGAVFTEGSF
ncbi:hypothetical protein GR140_31785 (plasmid) [Pseudomonas putida]|uniref:hypothetical protein n=1 Tax=Pseudomonas putida TaxID=303 RepID=UPI001BB053F8|nr:hypothetical protein [Pseudomonas putida]QUG93324.1 hypothetical protein GR140_31785 [Pseudomonas putida]